MTEFTEPGKLRVLVTGAAGSAASVTIIYGWAIGAEINFA